MEKEELSFVDDGPEECLLRCAETISGIGEVIIQLGAYEIDLSKNAWASLGRVEEYLGKAVEALGKKYYGAILDADRGEPLSVRLQHRFKALNGGAFTTQETLVRTDEILSELSHSLDDMDELKKLKEKFIALRAVLLEGLAKELGGDEHIKAAAAGETTAA